MSWLSLYKIVFMSELLIAEIMLTVHYPKRKGFAYLCPLAFLLCYGVALLYPERTVDAWFSSSIMFIVFFVVSIVALLMCFRVKFINLLFCALAAYTIQHLSYITFSLVNVTLLNSQAFISVAYDNEEQFSLSSIGGMMAFSFVVYIILYFIIYLVSQAILKKWVGKDGDLKFKSSVVIFFIALVLIADIVISDLFRYSEETTKSMEIFYCLLSILLCICLLFLQMNMIKSKDIEREMEVLSALYDEQQKHYQIRKETIDLINIKCHDFRHKIREVGSNRGVNGEVLQEMQDLISFYDAEISTGNPSLDIILTEKSLLCREKKIDFTCIVDGKQLSFIKDSDLYALFGNILDNAIEAVEKITDPTKRCVNFIVEKQQGAVFIREDNYYIGKITKNENGLIDTIKNDKEYHGFGMKSIQEITRRYNGILQVNTNKDIFQLSIIFFTVN